jgi:predicted phosphodiesterase
MEDNDIDFILHVGDMVDSGGSPAEYDTYYYDEMEDIAAEVPIYYAPGNHEYEALSGPDDVELVNFRENVENPTNSPYPEIFYSFDSPQGDTHFIVLNMEYYFSHDLNTTRQADQMAWYEADIAANDIDRIVVMIHRPLWGVNNARVVDEYRLLRPIWHNKFVDDGVDMVVQGHDHHFYHTVRNGTDYVTTGAGTAALTLPNPNGNYVKEELLETDFYFGDTYEVCLIEATESGFDVDVIVANGTTVYEFSVASVAADIYAPIITPSDDITMNVSTTGNVISWTVTDAYPDDYEIKKDGTSVASGSWTSGTAITYTIDELALGTYTFEITANDASGNSASDTVSVTVQEKPGGGGAPSFELPLALLSLLGVFLFKRRRTQIKQ